MRISGGMRSRLLGRLTATTAALALAGTAVVLMGAGAPGLASVRTAPSVAAVGPASAAIQINGFAFTPSDVSLANGGALTVQNNTQFAHTFTSVARDSTGKRFFDVEIPANSPPVDISAVSSLPDGTYAFYCRFHNVMTGTLTIGAGGPVTTDPAFEQPLVQPPRLDGKHPTIVMKKAWVRVLPHGNKTPMWTFGGTFPGPTIVRRTGQDTKVTYVNRLPRAAGAVTVHQHGGHQQSRFDGQPDSHLIRHGRSLTYDYPLRDGGTPLPAALRFYHDHRMNRTARNNWFGLQGMFLTTDPHDAQMGLPHGRYDIPLAVTDRTFDAENRLTDPFQSAGGMSGGPGTETVGDLVLVNGRYAPYKRVQPGLYRLQLLNTSLFSSYDFALSDGRAFTQIGTGSGLLPHPVSRQNITLGPAQRADVVVDFRKDAGQDVVLQSILPTNGADNGVGLMQFRVRGTPAPKAHVPYDLAKIQRLDVPNKVAMTWRFGLDSSNHWTINGKSYDPTRVDHRVTLGRTERWALVNASPFTHFVHLHEELWRTISRDGKPPPPWERGYEDTWRLDPGETVVVAAKFTDFTGDFMVHCHMLDHEDGGMMATFRVVK